MQWHEKGFMATTTINREPFKTTNEWSTSVDGSVSLKFGNKKNKLTFQTFGNSNITISSKFKSEKTAISVKRDAISSVEVNTKTYPIWLTIAVLIFLYSAIMMFPELEKFDQCTVTEDLSDPDLNEYYDCDYIPFGTQFGGFILIIICVMAYIITKRGRIILRVQSDADFRILVSSQAIPSASQMRELADAIMLIPKSQNQTTHTLNPNAPVQSYLANQPQPVQQQQSHVHANVSTGQQQRSELPPPRPPHKNQ